MLTEVDARRVGQELVNAVRRDDLVRSAVICGAGAAGQTQLGSLECASRTRSRRWMNSGP
jgi:hypothetical protein